MSTSMLNIEKLNGENYESWSLQMKSLLITVDYWDTITTSCPEGNSEEVKWKAKDQKALATLSLYVKPTELIHVKNCINTKEAWNKLYEIYRAKTPSRKVGLFKKLFRFQITSDEKMMVQINNFCSIAENLKEIDIAVPEDLLCILLLCSLPEDMENFVIAIESRDELPSLGQLKVKILEEEQRRGNRVDSSGAERVFAAKANRKGWEKSVKVQNTNNHYIPTQRHISSSNYNKSSNGTKKRNVQCYACGQRGHIRAECNSSSSKQMVMSACVKKLDTNNNQWILDSGASSHLCRDIESFNKLKKSTQSILLASGESVIAQGIGDVFLKLANKDIIFRDVLFVPNLHSNILSVSKIISYGHCVNFGNKVARVTNNNGEQCFQAQLVAGIFCVSFENNQKQEKVLSAIENERSKIWHSRFGHLNSRDLEKLSKQNMVRGMELKLPKDFCCFTCAECKIKVKEFKTNKAIYSRNCLELIHSDICGPMRNASQSGSRYFITFIDDYSRYVWTYFLKNKSEVLNVFKDFVIKSENQTGLKVKQIRSDNGREYLSSDFKQFLKERGIHHQLSVNYTPQQNGISERANRTLVEMARCMLAESKLPKSLWTEAINTATYLRNRSPTKLLKQKTPYECWFEKKPNVLHLKIFGCDAVCLNKKPGKSKFLPKGQKCSFVGYSEQSKAYRLYNKVDRTIIISRDVIFFEKSFSNFIEPSEELSVFDIRPDHPTSVVLENSTVRTEPKAEDEGSLTISESSSEGEDPAAGSKRKRGRPKILREGKVGRPRKIYVTEQPQQVLNQITTQMLTDPVTVHEALSSENSDLWRNAMYSEYKSLIKNNTWDLVDKPDSKNIIGCKWVFTTKRRADGTVEKYKARLVAHGCNQKYKVDYNDTYAPVARYATIRLVLGLAAQYKLFINHVDIVSAYLNGDLQEEVCMKQPEMFKDEINPGKVCRLRKSLYDLKQASREWNRKIDEILRNMSFRRSATDSCVYHRIEDGKVSIIVLYVDDMLVACSSNEMVNDIVSKLNHRVEAIDRGPIQYSLGKEINRDSPCGNINLHQTRFTNELLRQWNMEECKPASTPLPSGTVLSKCEDKKCTNFFDIKLYQRLMGSLTYLAMISRPDIAHTVSKLSQFNSHPHHEHFVAAKHVLRYLKGLTKGILSYSFNNGDLVIYTDADWGSDCMDRKSYSGYAVFFAGGPVSWESKKQCVVSLSSMEAEYIAMSQGAREVAFLRSLLMETHFTKYTASATTFFSDNQGAQFAVKNPTVHKRSKHIDIKFHYVRDKYINNEIDIKYIPTSENVADILTKSLPKGKHIQFCKMLNFKFS